MTAVPYLLALLAARADDDADTLADLRDLLGDEGAAAEALRHAGEDEAEEDGPVVAKSQWEESKHPRDHGKFSSKPGAGGGEIDMGTGRSIVGTGNTGNVIREGKEVSKNTVKEDGTKTREGEFYKQLSGTVGLAPGRQEGDKVKLPHYQEVLSIDTVQDERDRKSMGSVVGENKNRILNAVNAMSEQGIDYNDPLQVGFDDDFRAHVIDLSNAGIVDQKTALRANIERAARFMDDFGAEKTANDIRRAFSVYSHARLLSGGSAESAKRRMEAMAEKGNRTAQAIVSIGPEKVAGYDVKHAYYATNPRPVGRDGILQSEPDADGLKVILSDRPLDADTIRQYSLTPVVHPAERT